MTKTKKMPRTTYKVLAKYLGVSESAVKQYDPKKRELMCIGLKLKQEFLKTAEKG